MEEEALLEGNKEEFTSPETSTMLKMEEIVLVIKADTLEEASSTEVNSENKVSVEYGVVATNQGSLISDVN